MWRSLGSGYCPDWDDFQTSDTVEYLGISMGPKSSGFQWAGLIAKSSDKSCEDMPGQVAPLVVS